MPRQPEGRLVRKAQAIIIGRGGWVTKIHGSEFQEVGLPDLMGCYRGIMLGLEAKQPGEEPSKRQLVVLKRIAKAGGVVAVFTTLGEVVAILDRVDARVDARTH